MTGTRQLLAAVVLLLPAAACGEAEDDTAGGLSANDRKAAEALAATFQGAEPNDFEKESGTCLAEAFVESVGSDRLVEAKFLEDDLTVPTDQPEVVAADVAEGYADAIVECQDVRGEIEQRLDLYPDASDVDVDAYVECVEAIDDQVLRDAVIQSTIEGGDEEKADAYFEQTRVCEEQLGQPAAP